MENKSFIIKGKYPYSKMFQQGLEILLLLLVFYLQLLYLLVNFVHTLMQCI